MGRDQTHASYQQRILKVLTFIKMHLDEPLDLNQLAQLAFFSPHHFHRVFKSIVGETVKEHVLRLKLQRAMFELSMGKLSVTEIAFRAGFNSLEAFSRVIKQRFGMTPTGAREEMRETIKNFQSADELMGVKIVKLDKLDLAVVRHIGPYKDAGNAWVKLMQLTSPGAVMGKNAMRIGFAYDHPDITPLEKCCYDACCAWSDKYTEQGELSRITLEPGKYIMFVHNGSLETIDQSYGQFANQYLLRNDIEFSDRHNFMWYRNTAMLTNPKKQVTECYFPII